MVSAPIEIRTIPQIREDREVNHSVRNKILATVLMLLAVPFSTLADRDSPKLVFSAEPMRATFKSGEAITFRLRIENKDQTTVLVSPAFILGYDVTIVLTDPQSNSVSWCGVIAQWRPVGKGLVTLSPGANIQRDRVISCDQKHESGYLLSVPGKYKFVARYRVPRTLTKEAILPNSGPIVRASYESTPGEFSIVDAN